MEYLKKNGENPLVTIITVNYNNVVNLKKTLDSISNQTYPNVESVIIDGGSSDGSQELIKEFANGFAKGFGRCKWISESDEGLYYALNKAFDIATGDIIGCLWDEFADQNSLEILIDTMLNENADGVHGDLLYMGSDGKVIRKWQMGKGKILDGWMPGHPTLYLKKEIYNNYGKYDTDFVTAADYEYMVRILHNEEVRLAYVPRVVVKMFYGGLSTSSHMAYVRSTLEAYVALRKNGIHHAFLVIIRRIIRTLKQFQKA